MTDQLSPRRTRLPVTYLAVAVVILLAAAYLRATHYADWPPGLSHDEAINGIDAYRFVTTGVIPYYLIDGRSEPLFRIFVSTTVGLIGPTRFGMRIASFYFGVLGVAAMLRAGRHMVPPGPDPLQRTGRRWAALLAGGVLAAIMGHIELSRVCYRGIMLAFSLPLFVDASVVACTTHRRRHFWAAGLWLAWVVMSYTSGLAALPVAALGVLVQGVKALAESVRRGTGPALLPLRGWLRGVAWFGVAFLVCMSPMMVMWSVQPTLYSRPGEVVGGLGESSTAWDYVQVIAARISTTWGAVAQHGDPNPQYNAAQAPMLALPPLVWLLWVGIAACILRWRRVASWLALGLLLFLLLPVALSEELTHGLRISGEYGVVPLIVAASVDPLVWGLRRALDRVGTPRARRLAPLATGMLLVALIGAALVRSGSLHRSYFTSDVRWPPDVGGPAFSWFFETKREAVAQLIAASDEPVYVPVTEVYHPSFRYFTLRSHPRVTTFATAFGADAPLDLPPGRFAIPPWAEDATTFALFMPDGTLVLLPRFDDGALADLRAALPGSDRLDDPYGEYAAALIDFPARDASLRVAATNPHPVEINYGNQIRLLGWDGPTALPADGGQVLITLYLTPGPETHRDMNIFIQLWTVGLERIAGSEEYQLLRWVYPPGWWSDSDIVPVTLSITVPEGLPAGAMYLAAGFRDYRLRPIPALGPDGMPSADTAIAGTLKVPRSGVVSTEGMIEASATFGDQIELIGYRLADGSGAPLDALSPGEPVVVTLYWRALRRPDAAYTVFLHVTDPGGALVAQSDVQPEGGQYPTSIWDAGEIVATTHPITPPAGSSGPFTLVAGWYSFPSLERLPVVQDGAAVDDQRAVVAAP